MNLRELIEALEKEEPDKVIRYGFNNPHSYRGYYEQLAFEPAENVRVGEMLATAKGALGKTFQGYKGGDYVMKEHTDVWISKYGSSHNSDMIGPLLLKLMLEQEVKP